MFPEIFVKKHLVWSKPGELVFDPFSGRGTTVFESLLNDRRAIGCDTNPVAVCVSRAKSTAPKLSEILPRIAELRDLDDANYAPAQSSSEFFQLCFHPDTLRQVEHLRRNLSWKDDRADCFIAAVALGCLHGESHRSPRYFSNRMPRTISTKPEYFIRWWKARGCLPRCLPSREWPPCDHGYAGTGAGPRAPFLAALARPKAGARRCRAV